MIDRNVSGFIAATVVAYSSSSVYFFPNAGIVYD